MEGMGDRFVLWALLEWINPWDFFLDPQYSISYPKKKKSIFNHVASISLMKHIFR
jgi:hypothetical protein